MLFSLPINPVSSRTDLVAHTRTEAAALGLFSGSQTTAPWTGALDVCTEHKEGAAATPGLSCYSECNSPSGSKANSPADDQHRTEPLALPQHEEGAELSVGFLSTDTARATRASLSLSSAPEETPEAALTSQVSVYKAKVILK